MSFGSFDSDAGHRSVRNFSLPIAVGAALRLALALFAYVRTGTQVITQGDTASYLEPGRNLILHGIYASNGLTEIDRTPGYPLFMNLTGMLFNNAMMSVLCQIALSLLSLILVYRIAVRTFHSERIGLNAAWLYATEPISLIYTVRLMPETLFAVLLLLVIDRLLVYRDSGKILAVAWAGLLLTAATFVRPVSYYLAVPLAVWLIVTGRTGIEGRWKPAVILVLTTVPFLALWQVRNRIETGFSGFSSIVEKNLYFYQAAEVSAELEHIPLIEQQRKLGYLNESQFLAIHPDLRGASQSQRLAMMRRSATAILAENRLLYLKTHFVGVGVVIFTPCAAELLELIGGYPTDSTMPHRIVNEGVLRSVLSVVVSHPGISVVMCLFEGWAVILYVLSIIGAAKGNPDRTCLVVLAGIAIYFLLISGGAQAIGRYRLPVMPVVCIFAAGGIEVLASNRKRGFKWLSPALEVRS
jgi:4-amino-4-deoxy-L-arabinose transferase-like glycosyltransferase